MTHDCPTCGDEFDSERGVKVHHTKAHGRSIAGVEVECAVCGQSKTVQPSRVEYYDEHYCSDECKSIAKQNRVETECPWCGDCFEIPEYRLKQAEKVFCPGKDCRGKWVSEHYTGESHPNWKDDLYTEVDCSWCGDCLERRTDRVEDRSEHFFCNKECETKWKRENWPTGGENPLWLGGPNTHYGPNWGEKRREARKRDDYRCQSCGVHENQLDRELDVHHKTPFRTFIEDGTADYEAANQLENLVSLCQSCHNWAEQMAPLVPTRN